MEKTPEKDVKPINKRAVWVLDFGHAVATFHAFWNNLSYIISQYYKSQSEDGTHRIIFKGVDMTGRVQIQGLLATGKHQNA